MYDNTVYAFMQALLYGYKPTEDDNCIFLCPAHDDNEPQDCPFEQHCECESARSCIKLRSELRTAYRNYVAKHNPDIPIELTINDILVLKQAVDNPVAAIKALPEDNIIPVLRKIVKESALWEE